MHQNQYWHTSLEALLIILTVLPVANHFQNLYLWLSIPVILALLTLRLVYIEVKEHGLKALYSRKHDSSAEPLMFAFKTRNDGKPVLELPKTDIQLRNVLQ